MPRSLRLVPLLLVCALASGCFVPPDQAPTVGIGARLADRFIHRGMTQVNRPVLQPHLDVVFPTTVEGGQLGVRAEASMDLTNNVGAAWFPDGHAGRFTQMEYIADWTQQLGEFSVSGGIHSYNLPNGLEFPNGERGGTTEVFVNASTELLGAVPYVSYRYDFDEVRSSYFTAGMQEDFELAEGWTLTADGNLSYAGSSQAAWLYGLDESSFTNLQASLTVAYAYDERTTISGGLHGSAIMDSTLDDWFSQLGIDDDPWWLTVGVNWSF